MSSPTLQVPRKRDAGDRGSRPQLPLGILKIMTPEILKNLLQRAGLSPNKTYGQHFLMDETILEDMIDVAAVSKEDTVVEIGPGIGNLTERLLARAGQVLSLEKDPQFERVLRLLKKHHSNFEYELIDALKFNFSDWLSSQELFMSSPRHPLSSPQPSLPSPRHPLSSPRRRGSIPRFPIKSGMTKSQDQGRGEYKVVANIPYYITGKIVQLFLQQPHKPESLTLLMQKEVAKNIVAKPGQLNLLAISVQLYGQAKLVSIVPALKFYPKPKVDSAVIHIELYKKPKYKLPDEKKFFRVLRACFAGKRKQIHNTLVNNLGLEKDIVAEVLAKLKIEPRTRPQQLSIQQWVELVDSIE